MNLKTPYEHLITQKLDNELPIPDMADAIWERIATQLDADMPAEPQPDSAPAPANFVTKLTLLKWWAVGIGGIITLVVLLMLLSKSAKKKQRPLPPPTVEQPVLRSALPIPDTVLNNTTGGTRPPATYTNAAKLDSSALPVLQRDSIQNVALPAVATPPENLNLAPLPTSADSTQKQSLVPPKKPRGVPNISGKDYRISAGKKDSL